MKRIHFFSVGSLTLTKMDRLTITQRIRIIKTNYKNVDSLTAMCERIIISLRRDYGLHNRPNTQAIGKIVQKVRGTGVVTNIARPVHHRFARSTKNVFIVSESVAEYPDCLMAHFAFIYTPTFI